MMKVKDENKETETAEEFTPRDYQVDLYEKAVKGNVILYLPTGTGKTFIAVMLIKKLSADVRIPWHEGGKRTIFAVNTVPLVTQQSTYISIHTDLTCSGYSGDMNVDFWQKDQWVKEFEANQILVMTAQILVDLLNHAYLPLSRINLIIFDECHHGVRDHPMRQIMKTFELYDKSEHPKVLGLSATLLNCNVKAQNALIPIRELEMTFHAKVISVDSMATVSGYGKPCEKSIIYNLPVMSPVYNKLNDIFEYTLKILGVVEIQERVFTESSDEFKPMKKTIKLQHIFEDIRVHLNTLDLYVGKMAILYHLVQLEKLKNAVDDVPSLTILDFMKTRLMEMQKLIDNAMDEPTELANMMKYSSDKVIKLFNVLKQSHSELLSKDQKFCCIIFVERRFTAKILYHVLKKFSELHEDGKFLLPEYVVGNNANPYKSPVENMCLNKWNADALTNFRNGSINCLVATQVLDEGVDIPQCALVINFDTPKDFRSYVQGRGRARVESSKFIIFIENGNDKFHRCYQEYQNVEDILKIYLIGNTNERTEPLPAEISDFLYAHEIKPYTVINKNGVQCQISEVSAISFVNKYCAKLAQSKFSNAVPVYKLYKIDNENIESAEDSADNAESLKFLVSIRLPMLSPLRDVIYGDAMSTFVLAKRSAAMKVCQKLHEIGELTDQLLPRETSDVIENITVFLKYWQDELPENKKKVGEAAYKRSYELIYPQVLYGAFPVPDQDVYLHIIDAKPTYTPPTENRNRVFYNLLNNQSGYAILSTKLISKLPEFSIYMNMGAIVVKLQANYKSLKLSTSEIEDLRQFHWTIFRNVLELIKGFMLYDRANMENSFLIVPTDEKYEINWDVVREYKSVGSFNIDNPSIRAITNGTDDGSMNFYNWELVSPNYRTSTSIYMVTKVCNDLTPQSRFPTEDYVSYIHYFSEKHGQAITDTLQPLLEVKPISKKINYIGKREPQSLNKRKRDNLEEHLIPELCGKINFSALYWLKSMILPSILHRITQLLLAEDLRQQIVTEAQLGLLTKESGHDTWEVLNLSGDSQLSSDTEEMSSDNEDGDESTQLEDTLEEDQDPKNDLQVESEIDILSLKANVYPWAKEKEPCDLDRNIDRVQLMDIQYYNYFSKQSFATDDLFDDKQVAVNKHDIKPRRLAPILSTLLKISAYGPSAAEILPALTAKCAHDSFNLERLETLGDSFLKFITSLYLFEKYPYQNEGRLTGYKGKIIGNRYLYYCGVQKKIPGRIKVDNFEPISNFIVPSYCVPREIQNIIRVSNKSPNVLYEITIPSSDQFDGILSDETKLAFIERISTWIDATTATGVEHFTGIQIVPDKTVADAVEALTGVYLSSMGLPGATKLLQWFGVLPDKADIQKTLRDTPMSAAIGLGDPNIHMPWAIYIESILGYKFKDRSFLLQAFTHASYSPNYITMCYDRLEFLGDAIIDFLITIYIYENCGNLSPGELTDLRSALVNNITFACLTVKYKLHTALLSHAPMLFVSIERFVKFQEARNHVIDDELLWILLEEDDCDMAEYVDVPKVLGDLFESVIGAIYLDSGKNLHKVWDILYSFMHSEIEQFSKNVPKQAIRVVYETPGANPKFLKSEILEGSGRIMVTLQVQVQGKIKHFHGFGSTKKLAKVGAAKRALKSLRQSI